MRRTVYPEVPVHVEYALTEAGRTLETIAVRVTAVLSPVAVGWHGRQCPT